ncbi:alpha-glucoside-specific PTS transporter subunit IIBC [uncultured Ilyobacter sp.]|uniref:alpha-glucoside-specific PTS transporter subunit IIBC n=1 Tax=uncultured Ilyobacter sp. TaxID=544433 RepID=UPI0029C756AB|nr:alpha-glucoside-specific PTS transporter subunit IIBC [uncultured Ilyobacter sp.]
MFKQIQRLGGALFSPVLLFAFSGILVAITIILKNPDFVGELANPDGSFYQFVKIIEEGGWTVFRQMPVLFAIGLPIGLAHKANARASMVVFVSYMTFNYFINAILTVWGENFGVNFTQAIGGVSGLTEIAGVKTLDTSIIGGIFIGALVTYIHNKFFEVKLPDYLGIFQGSTLVAAISFFTVLPAAFVTCLVWPKIQIGIISLQGVMLSAGAFGVWFYTFLERILIPTGLHHFIYGPFLYGPAAVDGGIVNYWTQNVSNFAGSSESVKSLFPQGGFALHGNSKIFGSLGIALAMYKTALPSKKKIVLGAVIPAAITAVLAGITEPLEFTFLFIAPALFAIHAVLAATMATLMYVLGVVGNMGGGLIEIATMNWLPMAKNHFGMVATQIGIGGIFTIIYYFIFRIIIEKYNIMTPGRDKDAEVKLYSKKDFKEKSTGMVGNVYMDQAAQLLDALGGSANIVDVTNCATRLRLSVVDENLVAPDSVFKSASAHGVVRNGKSLQIIVGLSVPQVRDCFEELMTEELPLKKVEKPVMA